MYYDIITNTTLEKLPEGDLPLGRYSYKGQDGMQNLIPNKAGVLSIDGRSHPIHSQVLDPRLALNLQDIGDQMDRAKDFDTLCQIIPLNQKLDDSVIISDFEQYLIDHFFHIETICRNPHQKLTTEQIKLPVSRAKRIPKKGIRVLAAHSEDWAHRKLRSVVPKRILTEVRDETLLIYENKVGASFLTGLSLYLSERIEDELAKIMDFLDALTKIITDKELANEKTWYKKIHRNFELMGAAFQGVKDLQEKARTTVQELEKLRSRVLALFNSTLFSECRNYRITGQLIRTNLLVNDKHYRQLRLMYQMWQKQTAQDETEEQVQENHENTLKAFPKFVLLLFFRALKMLGYKLEDGFSLAPNEGYQFQHPTFAPIHLGQDSDQQFSLTIGPHKLRVVSLPDDWLRQEKAPKAIPANTLLVFYKDLPFLNPDEWKKPDYDWLSIAPSEDNQALIPVSLEHLDSVERITRCLRFYVLKEYYSHYPFEIFSKSLMRKPALKAWCNHPSIQKMGDKKNARLVLLDVLDNESIKELRDLLKEEKHRKSKSEQQRLEEILQAVKKANAEINAWQKGLGRVSFLPDARRLVFSYRTEEGGKAGTFKDKEGRAAPFLLVPKQEEILRANVEDFPCSLSPLLLDNLLGMDVLGEKRLVEGGKVERYER